jgi:hypothetical protein
MKYDLHGYWWRVEVGGGGGRTKTYIMCGGIGWGNVEFPDKYQICFFFSFFTVYFFSILKKNYLFFGFTENSIFFFFFLTFIFGRGDAHVEERSHLRNHYKQYIITRHCHL